MQLADFIAANKNEIIERWREHVTSRLSLQLEKSELRNDLPDFLDEVADILRGEEEDWRQIESAESHGRQRVRLGVDVGSLVEEMTMVSEAIAELANRQGQEFPGNELLRMTSAIGRGAAASVRAYAGMRDKQLADQAAQHFSFIAHEIRNPLHSAQLAAQLLTAAPRSDRKKSLERLDRALSQLSDLVDDSLIEARLFGEPRLEVRKMDSAKLVEDICYDLAGQIDDRDLRVETKVDEFQFDADPALMHSALANLVSNAAKFSRRGGTIVISARQDNDRAKFTVEDRCGGIPEDFMPRLFEPFRQAESRKGGSGLGLMIVKQAVEAHQGEVHVHNVAGKGCCFTLDLPMQKNDC